LTALLLICLQLENQIKKEKLGVFYNIILNHSWFRVSNYFKTILGGTPTLKGFPLSLR
jgi:hypothetical protein